MERLRKRKLPTPKPEEESQTVFKCKKCQKVYSRADTLRVHELSMHSKKKILCSLCSKQFSSNNKLRRHELTHKTERAHKCKLCLKTFKRADALLYHQRTVHSKEQGTQKTHNEEDLIIGLHCEYCLEKNCPRHHLISVICHGKPYTRHQCTICLKIAHNCSLNWKHEQFDHSEKDKTKEKGHQCKVCHRLFATHKTLLQHGRCACFSLESSEPLIDVRPLEAEMEVWRNSITAKALSP